jgi:hypothetical protein
MTVTLGALTLSDDLVLGGLETAPDLVVNQKRTLSGRSILQTAPISGGRTLTLSSERHCTLAQVQAIKAMAALRQPVTLVHHRGSFTVLITATALEPDDGGLHSNPTAGEWYSGDITLIEV